MTDAKSTMIDLFAGCGGMTQGFVDAGFNPIFAVEHDLAAAATYAANFGDDHTFWGDIANVPDRAVPEAEIVIGGPPCQGFSNLGTRDPEDPRNKLWRQYVRIVLVARPKVFVIENVERFHRSFEFALLEREVTDGDLSDYEITSGVLDAADFGVAQRRRRTIVIGSRVGRLKLPSATHSESGLLGLPWRSVADAFDGVPWQPTHMALPDRKSTFFGESVPGPFKETEIHLGRNPHQISLERYDHVPPGGGRFDLPDHLLPDCWRNKPTGTTDVMGRMRWDSPSVTIRTEFFKPEKGRYLHPQWDPADRANRVNRPITHREAARLQDFPQDFVWCGSKTQIARQIGNAVPVGLAEAIGVSIRAQLEGASR